MSTGRQNCIQASSSREPPERIWARGGGGKVLIVWLQAAHGAVCGVGWQWGEEGNVGCWPSEEVAGGMVSSVLCWCQAGDIGVSEGQWEGQLPCGAGVTSDLAGARGGEGVWWGRHWEPEPIQSGLCLCLFPAAAFPQDLTWKTHS